MSQDNRKNSAPSAPDALAATNPEARDRREFIRQSLGVAPLMLTLGGRGYGGGTSMHGTLWSSLGTKWQHKEQWFGWDKRGWHWSKQSGDSYREHEQRGHYDRKDERPAEHKDVPARKDWDWNKSDERWSRDLEAHSKRKDAEWERHRSEAVDTDREYDWRDDNDWKRSEGLSPFASKRSDRKKD